MDAPRDNTGSRAEQAAPAGEADGVGRAERLLGHLRKALAHDLPNQLLAVQGLLQELLLGERPRLSADGQELVGRAAGAAQRAQAMVASLKELARLGCDQRLREVVVLRELLAELGAEVKTLCPGCRLDGAIDARADRVTAARRPLHDGLLRLLRSRGGPGRGGPRRFEIRSRRVPAAVELTVAVSPPGGRPEGGPPGTAEGASAGGPSSADRLEWALVQELLGECGRVTGRQEPDGGEVFALVVPDP